MGSWGVGLYANDKAQDVRIDTKYYFWKYGEKALEKILELYYEEDIDDTENDNVNVWVAIADFMWKNGILTEEVKAKTLAVLNNPKCLDGWEEEDKKGRKKVLDAFKAKILSPQPPAKKIVYKPVCSRAQNKVGQILKFTLKDEAFLREWYQWPEQANAYRFVKKFVPIKWLENLRENGTSFYAICVDILEEYRTELHEDENLSVKDTYSVYAVYDWHGKEELSLEEIRTLDILDVENTSKRNNFFIKGTWTKTSHLTEEQFEVLLRERFSFYPLNAGYYAPEKYNEFRAEKVAVDTNEVARIKELLKERKHNSEIPNRDNHFLHEVLWSLGFNDFIKDREK